MESEKLHNAADWINLLIDANANDKDLSVSEIEEALSARDDLREIANSGIKEVFDIPEPGEVLNDPYAPRWSSGDVEIFSVPGTIAENHVIDVDGRTTTVAEENPGEPENAPVVKGTYVEGSEKLYSFPVTRLDRIE